MTLADRVHSTPPLNSSSNIVAEPGTPGPVHSSRRSFLARAAAVAAGGAALGAAMPLPRPAAGAEQVHDPIFALIETHRATTEALNAVLREKGRLEKAGQESDESLEDAAFEAEEDALTELIETVPATLAGVIASMTYITKSAERDAYRYSEEYLVPLLANLCGALESLSGQEGGSHAQS